MRPPPACLGTAVAPTSRARLCPSLWLRRVHPHLTPLKSPATPATRRCRAQFSVTSPGTLLSATQYSASSSLMLVNVSSYNETGDYYDPAAQRMTMFYSQTCVVGKFSFAAATLFPVSFLLKMLCDGVAGMGLTGQTLTAAPDFPGGPFGHCYPSQLPPKSTIGKFKASPTAKAACAKVKDLLAGVSWDNPMGAEAGKTSKKVANASYIFNPIDCTVSWKADLNFADKVGG